MSYNQPPDPPQPGGYDPNQGRTGGGYDPNATTPMGGTPGGYQPPPTGGYGGPTQPEGGGYEAPTPPVGGGYGAPPPPGGPGYFGGPPVQPVGTSWAAIVGLIAGILSIITCCLWCLSGPLGIAAVALYFVAQGQLRQGMGGKGLAMAGLICGIIGVLLTVLVTVFSASLGESEIFRDLFLTATAIANPN